MTVIRICCYAHTPVFAVYPLPCFSYIFGTRFLFLYSVVLSGATRWFQIPLGNADSLRLFGRISLRFNQV
jgi:hypothetical protein